MSSEVIAPKHEPSRRRKWVFLLLTFSLLFVFAESGAALWFWWRSGSLASVKTRLLRERNSHLRAALAGKSKKKCTYLDTLFPHPYYSFVGHGNKPCGNPFFNGEGFKGRPFPPQPSKRDFHILLTGGSVAHQLAHMDWNSDNYLEVLLNRNFVAPKGGRFVVHNGAQGAWKQPQAAIVYLLNWENLDGVITLDGFNEWSYLFSGLHLNHPASHFRHVNPALKSGYRVLLKLELSARLYQWNREHWLASRSHLLYGLVKALRDALTRRSKHDQKLDAGKRGSQKNKASKQKTTMATLYKWPKKWPKRKRVEQNFRLYQGYIRAIHTLAQKRGASSAHFLQPVGGYGKPLTPDERKAMSDPKEYVPEYRRLVKRMMVLKKEGIPMVSLLELFSNVKERVYADNVHCRFSTLPEGNVPAPFKGVYFSKGYALMAEAMVRRLGVLWKLTPKYNAKGAPARKNQKGTPDKSPAKD